MRLTSRLRCRRTDACGIATASRHDKNLTVSSAEITESDEHNGRCDSSVCSVYSVVKSVTRNRSMRTLKYTRCVKSIIQAESFPPVTIARTYRLILTASQVSKLARLFLFDPGTGSAAAFCVVLRVVCSDCNAALLCFAVDPLIGSILAESRTPLLMPFTGTIARPGKLTIPKDGGAPGPQDDLLNPCRAIRKWTVVKESWRS